MLADGNVNKFNTYTSSEEVCDFDVIRSFEPLFIFNKFGLLLYVGVGNVRLLARVSYAGRDGLVIKERALYSERDLWSNLIR